MFAPAVATACVTCNNCPDFRPEPNTHFRLRARWGGQIVPPLEARGRQQGGEKTQHAITPADAHSPSRPLRCDLNNMMLMLRSLPHAPPLRPGPAARPKPRESTDSLGHGSVGLAKTATRPLHRASEKYAVSFRRRCTAEAPVITDGGRTRRTMRQRMHADKHARYLQGPEAGKN